MKTILWILILVLFTSCIKSTKEKEAQKTAFITTKIENKLVEIKKSRSTDSLIIENRSLHEFSQVDKKDEFYVCIKGKSISEGNVIFEIKNHKGDILLKEEFPTYLLMNYGFTGNPNSKEERENYMKTRIAEFFNEKNFSNPAIEADDNFDANHSNKEIWDDIRSDQSAIGFRYILGEEDGRGIAYSKKNGKVVMYFNCC